MAVRHVPGMEDLPPLDNPGSEWPQRHPIVTCPDTSRVMPARFPSSAEPLTCNGVDLLVISTLPSRLVDLTAAGLRRWIRTAVMSVIADAAFSSEGFAPADRCRGPGPSAPRRGWSASQSESKIRRT